MIPTWLFAVICSFVATGSTASTIRAESGIPGKVRLGLVAAVPAYFALAFGGVAVSPDFVLWSLVLIAGLGLIAGTIAKTPVLSSVTAGILVCAGLAWSLRTGDGWQIQLFATLCALLAIAGAAIALGKPLSASGAANFLLPIVSIAWIGPLMLVHMAVITLGIVLVVRLGHHVLWPEPATCLPVPRTVRPLPIVPAASFGLLLLWFAEHSP